MKTMLDQRVWDKMTKGTLPLATWQREVGDRAYREMVVAAITDEPLGRFEHDA